ncbi:S8/S53 family peptidase [Demequina capsici]|uniref:S8/S53 family peptidase n=1 Tax=Demequina capsici TaxID=3075620 RepID=A0AA96JA02_9MICO|nr:S8/S53 family peptidase [Demequina sp. PMTSA13]WNM26925.1 S8/S53 family peptidase [Demequina sp. PMTSA13]
MNVVRRARAAATPLLLACWSQWAAAPPATAEAADGQWYLDDLHIADLHSQGIDGSGVVIAVIDDAINTEVPTLGNVRQVRGESFCADSDGASLRARSDDPARALHGTTMVSLIAGDGTGDADQAGIQGIAPGAVILFYSARGADAGCYDRFGTGDASSDAVAAAITAAAASSADIIVVAPSVTTNPEQALIDAYVADAIVLAPAAGADDATHAFPAASNGVVTVGAYGPDGQVSPASGGAATDVVAPGLHLLAQGDASGWEDLSIVDDASYAAAVLAGELALAIEAHPEASHGQILQSMLASTSSGVQRGRNGDAGYGVVSLAAMRADDPHQYTSTNPFLGASSANGPTQERVASAILEAQWEAEHPAPTAPTVSASPASPTAPAASRDVTDDWDEHPPESALFSLIMVGVPLLSVLLVLVGALALLSLLVYGTGSLVKRRRGRREADPTAGQADSQDT